MGLSAATLWWIAAGLAVAVELATGTFYLLMLALGLVAGALSAQFGTAAALQFIAFAAVGGGATALWHWKRFQQPHSEPARANRDVNLDIGESVSVTGWSPDRTARVHYRGSEWTARLDADVDSVTGPHQIVAVEGNWLVLAPRPAGTPLPH